MVRNRNNNVRVKRSRGSTGNANNQVVLRRNNGANNRKFKPRRKYVAAPVNSSVRRNIVFNNINPRNNAPFNNSYNSGRLYAPRAVAFNVQNRQPTDLRLTRNLYVATVSGTSTIFQLAALTIHPLAFPWIDNLAKMYDKYMFTSFQIRYVSMVSAATNGNSIIGFNYEDHQNLVNNFADAQAYDKFTVSPLWAESSWISIPNNVLTDKWYDCEFKASGDSFHDYSPARIVFGHDGNVSSRNTTFGRIEARFTIRFSRPTTNNPSTTVREDFLTQVSESVVNENCETESVSESIVDVQL